MAHAAADVRAAEEPLLARERAFAGGLMDTAATALAGSVRRRLVARRGRVVGGTVVGLVGAGNNGGDALHALARLAARGVRCVAVVTVPTVHVGGLDAFLACGGAVLCVVDGGPGRRVWVGDALAEAVAADVVVDGLLGIGSRGALRGPAAELVLLLGELLDGQLTGRAGPAGRAGGGRPGEGLPDVVAVDLPSGIGVDDGAVPGAVLRADVTVTFGAAKPGLLLPPAALLCGDVEVVDLGLELGEPAVRRLGADDARALWPVPTRAAHKYSRGVVGVVAGTAAYPGAAVLTVAGAQGAGCGMVRYVGPDRVRDAVVAAHPEVVTTPDVDVRVQAWVLGPGVDPGDGEQVARVRRVLDRLDDEAVPVVVDAGALGLLPGRVPPRVVLTPHAGELARLLGSRGVDVDRAGVEAEPLRWVREAHERTGATVLLKGPVTVVVGPEGVWTQADAPAWLATAGAGDVLAGVLGAVLAGRGTGDGGAAAALAALAALVHGRAAVQACPGGPVTAGDVARALPPTIAGLLTTGGRPV